jgi:hypothetical protein
MEFQLKPGMLAISAEGFGLGLLRIEDREHVTDLAFCMARKLFEPADRDFEWRIGWHFRSSHVSADSHPAPPLYPNSAFVGPPSNGLAAKGPTREDLFTKLLTGGWARTFAPAGYFHIQIRGATPYLEQK